MIHKEAEKHKITFSQPRASSLVSKLQRSETQGTKTSIENNELTGYLTKYYHIIYITDSICIDSLVLLALKLQDSQCML